MREIKFRGKRIDNNEWIYGYLIYDYDMADDYVPFIIWKDEKYLGGSGEEQIIEHTIGQYTGLKDKNGKEIYEGDIIQHLYEYSDITDRYLVDWDEEELRYVFQNLSNRNNFCALEDMYDDYYGNYAIEVIGNIYDNLELLEG